MTEELAYALITPYSLYKSRTGGIIGRLLAYAKCDFVAARMFVFSDEFISEYRKIICPPDCDPAIAEAWRAYVDSSMRQSNRYGYLPRCLLLLFRGENAVRHLKEEVIGAFTEAPVGDTVRGTYGDFIRDENGKIHYFEPAVLTCPSPAHNDQHLRLFAQFADADGGVLTGRIQHDAEPQVSLVMLKPDNFYQRSRRPGNIIDAFSLTGLRIVGVKLFNMTVAQGEDFYGPLKAIFVRKLRHLVARQVQERLKDAFDFKFAEADAEILANHLAERNAITEFNKIVEYMTGINPMDISPAEKPAASRTKCLAMLYEGPGAIDKIRAVLGSTDPTKAEPGTVRSDFGRDLMRNGAHASDSVESAVRERRIVGLADDEPKPSDVRRIIEDYLARRR